ncbi:MAG TPA: cyclodeaminase/cyclohydrolase family protein [Phycisphaerales bacterium]|nr:cyclodeaminase/cyclohydrolase family protein [Phycisphaerales bacterium]HMP37900.1 cyclodeaminase/cyclohydrolase family protein [Phycisphaerales bacterium]
MSGGEAVRGEADGGPGDRRLDEALPAGSLGAMSVAAFLDALAARTPAPGGGAVAATTLATAAALGRMVLGYTLGRPRFAGHDALHRAGDEAFRAALPRLLELADADARGYAQLDAALRGGLRERDPAAFAAAASGAVEPPLEMLRLGRSILDALRAQSGTTNPSLESDRVIAERLASAGVEAARLNVEANLSLLSETRAAELLREIERIGPRT